jgi:hypothetical protein
MRVLKQCIVIAVATTAVSVVAGSPAPTVGTAAPELNLEAADGSSRSLAAIDGPKILIFYRGLW